MDRVSILLCATFDSGIRDMTIRLIYIGGYSRSGSTLLLRLLGEVPGLVAVGELFDLWQRSYIENQLCGCGERFQSCGFWREVTSRTFSCRPEDVASLELQEFRRKVQGHSHIPQLWFQQLRTQKYRDNLHGYADLLANLYRSIGDISRAEFIVDSSKIPQYSWLLGEMPDTELHMVHLVRDSRATAYSWQREKVRPEIAGKTQYMDRHSVVRSALEWNIFHLMLRSKRTMLASYTLIRYEDLVLNPIGEIRRIASSVGAAWTLENLGQGYELTLSTSHTASGNPSRFSSGRTAVRPDDEWKGAMPWARKSMVSAITLTGLARYGYLHPDRDPDTLAGTQLI